MKRKQITVRELIDLLLALDTPNAPVWVEGCDCEAEAAGISKDADGAVMVCRDDNRSTEMIVPK